MKDFFFLGIISNWVCSYVLERFFNFSIINIGVFNFIVNWNLFNGLEVDRYFFDVLDVISFLIFVLGFEGRDVGNVILFDVVGLNCGVNYYWWVRVLNDIIVGFG